MNVELGPDSSFDVEPKENAENGEEEENIYDNHPEFETTSSSILNELRQILSELSTSDNSGIFDGSDPDLTGGLAGMIGEQDKNIPNPFQLCERVKQELISRAEQAGSRALD